MKAQLNNQVTLYLQNMKFLEEIEFVVTIQELLNRQQNWNSIHWIYFLHIDYEQKPNIIRTKCQKLDFMS